MREDITIQTILARDGMLPLPQTLISRAYKAYCTPAVSAPVYDYRV